MTNYGYETACSTRKMLDELLDAAKAGEEYEEQDAQEYLEDWPLEIVWEMGEEFAVVLGTGGPHVEITGGGRRGGYELSVYWGGDKSTVRSDGISWAGEHFRSMVDENY